MKCANSPSAPGGLSLSCYNSHASSGAEGSPCSSTADCNEGLNCVRPGTTAGAAGTPHTGVCRPTGYYWDMCWQQGIFGNDNADCAASCGKTYFKSNNTGASPSYACFAAGTDLSPASGGGGPHGGTCVNNGDCDDGWQCNNLGVLADNTCRPTAWARAKCPLRPNQGSHGLGSLTCTDKSECQYYCGKEYSCNNLESAGADTALCEAESPLPGHSLTDFNSKNQMKCPWQRDGSCILGYLHANEQRTLNVADTCCDKCGFAISVIAPSAELNWKVSAAGTNTNSGKAPAKTVVSTIVFDKCDGGACYLWEPIGTEIIWASENVYVTNQAPAGALVYIATCGCDDTAHLCADEWAGWADAGETAADAALDIAEALGAL